MSSERLSRLSGLSVLIGCILIVLVSLPGVFLSDDPTSAYTVYSSLGRFLGGILLVLGLPGVYASQARRAGILGLIGLALILINLLILGAFGDSFNALIVPYIATHAPAIMKNPPSSVDSFFLVGGILGVLGGILFGIATIRAGVLSRWAAILLIVGSVVQFLGDALNLPIANPGFLLFMIGLAWLGLNVMNAKQAAPAVDIPVEAARS